MKKLFLGMFFTGLLISLSGFSQGINKLDANGKRTGVWIKKYPRGGVRYKGQFVNGKEVGEFKFYEPRQLQPSIIKTFQLNSDIAEVQFFSDRGKLKAKGQMKGKNRIGKWVFYYPSGKVLSIEHYKNGKLDGLLTNFYPHGVKTNETMYSNGLRNGNSKTYTDEEILIEDVTYEKGSLNGPAKFYDLKGNLTEEGNFSMGIRKGHWDFYMDGEKTKRKKNKLSSYK